MDLLGKGKHEYGTRISSETRRGQLSDTGSGGVQQPNDPGTHNHRRIPRRNRLLNRPSSTPHNTDGTRGLSNREPVDRRRLGPDPRRFPDAQRQSGRRIRPRETVRVRNLPVHRSFPLRGLSTLPCPASHRKGRSRRGSRHIHVTAFAILITTFPEGRERNRALGIFISVLSAGFAAGSILGGVLTAAFGWRSIMFVNVPIGVVGAVLSQKFLAGFLHPPDPGNKPANSSHQPDEPRIKQSPV